MRKIFIISGVLAISAFIGAVSPSSVGAAIPPASCFAFTAGTGTITNYFNNQANNPANPACPKEVDIPSTIGGATVRVITGVDGTGAFQGKGLSAVTIPSTVTTIGSHAFRTNQLTSVTIPSSVTTIGVRAFGDNQLAWVALPSSLSALANGVFENNQLTSVTIPSSVTSIGNYAFINNKLTSVTIPEAVTLIGDGAFQSNKLTSAIINATSVATLGGNVFAGNLLDSIPSYFSRPSVLAIPNATFLDNQLSDELVIPSNIVTIGNRAFENNQLTSVTVPSSVTTIGRTAFAYNDLTEVSLAEGLQTMGQGALFANNLSALMVPSSLLSLQDPGACTPNATMSCSSIGLQQPLRSLREAPNDTVSNAQLVSVFTADPANPRNLMPALEFGYYVDPITSQVSGNFIAGGYLINPAHVNVSYKTADGVDLHGAEVYTGVAQNGAPISDRSVANIPVDQLSIPLMDTNPTPGQTAENQVVLEGLFYHMGDEFSVEAPDVEGYLVLEPASIEVELSGGVNAINFVYEEAPVIAPAPSDPVSTDVPADQRIDDVSSGDDSLADTGSSMWLTLAVALGVVLGGLAMLFHSYKKSIAVL